MTCPRPDFVLRFAALMHDVGKPRTRRFEPGGGVSFHHHETVGARMTLKRMQALRFSTEVSEDVSRLVELHLRFHGYGDGDWTDSAVRRYVRDAGPLLPRLHRLTRADCTTRNRRKAAALEASYDHLEERIADLESREELAAIRPDLDGNQVMAILGIGPGREVGQADGLPARPADGARTARRGRGDRRAARLVGRSRLSAQSSSVARVSRTSASVHASGVAPAGRPSASTFSGREPTAVRCPASQSSQRSAFARSPAAAEDRANNAVSGVQDTRWSRQSVPGAKPPAGRCSRRSVVVAADADPGRSPEVKGGSRKVIAESPSWDPTVRWYVGPKARDDRRGEPRCGPVRLSGD